MRCSQAIAEDGGVFTLRAGDGSFKGRVSDSVSGTSGAPQGWLTLLVWGTVGSFAMKVESWTS